MINLQQIMTVEIQTKPNLFLARKPPLLLTGIVLLQTNNGNDNQVSAQKPVKPKGCRKCGNAQGVRQTETLCPNCTLENIINHHYSTNKLSQVGWEQLRLFFKLPQNIKQISFDQARGVALLLYLFVKNFSLEQQKEIAEAEILDWLSNCPSLPKVIAKSIKKRLKNHRQSSPANISQNLTFQPYVEAAPKKNKRKSVSQQKFSDVAIRQGMFCFWCGVGVVKETQIVQSKRVTKSLGRIQYYSGDELRDDAIATIDHLIRVIDGGTNEVANLVISCANCNFERDKVTNNYDRPFSRPRIPCFNCGGRFFHPDWGCCSICGATPKNLSENLLVSFWSKIKSLFG